MLLGCPETLQASPKIINGRMLPKGEIFIAIRATLANYKYTLNIKVWQLIFYIIRPQNRSVSKPDTSCIKNELQQPSGTPKKL